MIYPDMESHQAPEPIEIQPMGVPADPVDLNHPQYLRGIEAQTSNRPPQHTPVMSKTTRNILPLFLFIVSSLAFAMAVGATIGVCWDPEPVPATSTTLSPGCNHSGSNCFRDHGSDLYVIISVPVFGVPPPTTIMVFVPPTMPIATCAIRSPASSDLGTTRI